MANTWNAAAAAELRAEMGRGQVAAQTLATASGLAPSSIHRKVKKAERAITLDEFAAMSLALGIDPVDMFDRVAASHDDIAA